MKNWQETHRVFAEMKRLGAERKPSALATIVRLEGSSYRQPGAKLLIREDGTLVGNVSGGCLENDVREIASKVMKDQQPKLAHYDTTNDDVVWGLGVGCGGKVDILVQSSGAQAVADTVDAVLKLTAGDDAFAISTIVSGPLAGHRLVHTRKGLQAGCLGHADLDRQIAGKVADQLAAGESAFCEFGDAGVFIEVLVPPPHLVICGASDDSMPLARLATEAGFRVTVADHRPAYAAQERLPGAFRVVLARPGEQADKIPASAETYAIVKTHVMSHDHDWIEYFASRGVSYVGLLASRTRREKVTKGIAPDLLERLYSPVGLDIGAEGPEQVAVSIVAELLAVCSGREPRHLKERKEATHAL